MSPHSIYNNSLYESRTTPYHPQGNGQTKQMNWTLNWKMMGLDFFNPKITRQGIFSTLKSQGDDFFVHGYHGAYTNSQDSVTLLPTANSRNQGNTVIPCS